MDGPKHKPYLIKTSEIHHFQCHIKTRGKNLHQPPKWNGQQGGKKVLK